MNARQKGLALLLLFSIFVYACQSGAKDSHEAAARLVKAANWNIQEIWVNDALTFSDGKMKPQFGGIDFERYMETVRFEKGGAFSGYFKGESKPMPLRWKMNANNVTVGALDSTAKGGEWTILPKDVFEDSFTMKTQSTAYDFPRFTTIALKFKTDK